MKSPTLQMTGLIPVAEIDTRDRIRPFSEAGVDSIIASIGEVGVMKDPIHVRRKKGGALVLIAGGHRLEAAKRLGWSEIEAKVWVDVTDDWSSMMEIDDNLAGAELTALDTAIFLARRKEVYERLHPETKAKTGSALIAHRWHTADIVSVVSFAKVTAEKFGIDERHVRRLVAAGSKISPKDAQLLRSAPKAISLKDLSDLSKVATSAERYDVVASFAAGEVKKIADAIRARKRAEAGVEPDVKDPVEAAFKALATAWARAPMAARRRFLHEQSDAIAAMEGYGE